MINEDIYKQIKELAKKYEQEVIEIRRDIHMHPELAFQEVRTSKLVADKLEELGIEVQTGIAGTGVVGLLKGKNPGKTVILRADMDALPIKEATDLPFQSVNDGVMHACGHDCHTANLLGAAMILSELKDELNGNIKFVFQPAEEYGFRDSGGYKMINEGILENPKVDAAFALHVGAAPLGIVGLKRGVATSATDKFTLRIKGKQSHSSAPYKGVDAMVIAANIIITLQTILSRQIKPEDIATFNLGTIKGGTSSGIIPDLIEIGGMMRCASEDARNVIITNIEKISKSIAEGMGGECEFIFSEGYPSLLNDNSLIDIVKDLSLELYKTIQEEVDFGFPPNFDIKRLISVSNSPSLGGEDFAHISQKVPSCYFFLGSGVSAPQHSPKFMVNEKVFKISLNLLPSAAVKFLNN